MKDFVLKNKIEFKFFLILNLAAFFIGGGWLFVKAQEIPDLPADVREMVPEKDLLEVFCLTTKWKSGEFFATMEALQEVLIADLQEIQNIGLTVQMPDLAGYNNQGQEKLNAICSAGSWPEARAKLQDFIVFGESVRQSLAGLNNSLGQDLKAEGEKMKSEIEGKIDAWLEEEKGKIEEELNAEAFQLSEQLRIQLEQGAQNMNFSSEEAARAYGESGSQRIKATVEARINELVEIKKAELAIKVNNKISEIIGMDVDQFRAIGEKMENIEERIKEAAAAKTGQYEQYKIQAMAKRKELITAVLDGKISQAIGLIKEKESLLAEARLNDPTVKTAGDYIADLQKDKEIFINKIQAAIDNSDEAAINSAIQEIQDKWLAIRGKLEADLAKRQSPAEICSQVVPQISQAEQQIKQGLEQIRLAREEIDFKKQECELSSKSICQQVNDIYDRLFSAEEKTRILLEQINKAQEKCAAITEISSFDEDFLNLMINLRNQGSQWQKEIAVLKNQWLSGKSALEKELAKKPDIKAICGLPELAAGKIEAQKKLDELNERLARCDRPCLGTTEACVQLLATCNLYKARSLQFESARQKGEEVLAEFSVIDQKCGNPSDTSLSEIISLAKQVKEDGEEFLNLYKEAIN